MHPKQTRYQAALPSDDGLLALDRELANVTPDDEDVEWAKEERKRNARKRQGK